MRRPIGVTCIAWLVLLNGCSWLVLGVAAQVWPALLQIKALAPFAGIMQISPRWAAFAVAALWWLTAWGLFRMNNWARWFVMVLFLVRLAFLIPRAVHFHLGVTQLALWTLDVALHAAIFDYLVLDRTGQQFSARVRSSPPFA